MNDSVTPLVDIVKRIYSGICAYPNDLRIQAHPNAAGVTLQVFANPNDVSKLIGGKAKIFHSVRLLLEKIGKNIWITDSGSPRTLRVSLEIVNTGTQTEKPVRIPINTEYDTAKLDELIKDLAGMVFSAYVYRPSHLQGRSDIEICTPLALDPIPEKLRHACQKEDEELASDNLQGLAFNTIFYAYARATGRIVNVQCTNG